MPHHVRTRIRRLLGPALLALPFIAPAWEMRGEKTIELHGRDGSHVAIGSVSFRPEGAATGFELRLDLARFKDFFLSMKEFKCLETVEEIQCHVPYPYPHPASVSPQDLRWLEHSLLFLFKAPKDHGAKLWNGLYYRMAITADGIVGTAQAVDLNAIGAPPESPDVPPYGEQDLSEIAPGARWFDRLTIR